MHLFHLTLAADRRRVGARAPPIQPSQTSEKRGFMNRSEQNEWGMNGLRQLGSPIYMKSPERRSDGVIALQRCFERSAVAIFNLRGVTRATSIN